jgi:hypothetical protein
MDRTQDIKSATFVGMVSTVVTKLTKRGTRMATFTLEDTSGSIECITFKYDDCAAALVEDAIVKVKGKFEHGDRGNQIIVYEVESIELIRNYETVDWCLYWNWYTDYESAPAILSEGERLFAEALAAAETDQQKAAVGKSQLQMGFLRAYYEGKRISVGESIISPIDKMVANFCRENPDAFTPEEEKAYRDSVAAYAREAVYAKYAADNRALAEEMISHRVYSLREGPEGWIDQFDELDFAKLPGAWRS